MVNFVINFDLQDFPVNCQGNLTLRPKFIPFLSNYT